MTRAQGRAKVWIDLGVHENPYGGPFQYGRALLEGLSQIASSTHFDIQARVGSDDPRVETELRQVSLPWNQYRPPRPRQLFATVAPWMLPPECKDAAILHGTSNLVSLRGRGKKVVTIHDLIQVSPHLEPTSSWGRKRYVAARALGYRAIFACMRRRVDQIVTVHHHQREVLEHYFSPRHPIAVAYTPIPSLYLTHELPPVQRISDEVLLLASRDLRKNIPSGMRALSQVKEGIRMVTVVIATRGLRRWAEALPWPHGVERRIIEEPDEQSLRALLCRASVLLFPSVYEGFGIPLYQALACRTPVVAKDDLLIPELDHLRGSGFWGCDTKSEGEIAAAVSRALSHTVMSAVAGEATREILRANASPRSLAQAMVKVYEEVYGRF